MKRTDDQSNRKHQYQQSVFFPILAAGERRKLEWIEYSFCGRSLARLGRVSESREPKEFLSLADFRGKFLMVLERHSRCLGCAARENMRIFGARGNTHRHIQGPARESRNVISPRN